MDWAWTRPGLPRQSPQLEDPINLNESGEAEQQFQTGTEEQPSVFTNEHFIIGATVIFAVLVCVFIYRYWFKSEANGDVKENTSKEESRDFTREKAKTVNNVKPNDDINDSKTDANSEEKNKQLLNNPIRLNYYGSLKHQQVKNLLDSKVDAKAITRAMMKHTGKYEVVDGKEHIVMKGQTWGDWFFTPINYLRVKFSKEETWPAEFASDYDEFLKLCRERVSAWEVDGTPMANTEEVTKEVVKRATIHINQELVEEAAKAKTAETTKTTKTDVKKQSSQLQQLTVGNRKIHIILVIENS